MSVSHLDPARTSATRRYFPKPLLTEAEMAFWSRLRRVVPQFVVCPQVAMGALVDPPRCLTGEYREKARRRYQSKIVDFAVYDPKSGKVICLVELDDPSHDDRLEQDVERDAITIEAGYVTLRWDVREPVGDDELAAKILHASEYPEQAYERALREHEERRALVAQQAKPVTNLINLANRLPAGYRSSPRGRQEPSVRAVAIKLIGLLIVGAVGYVLLPHAMKWYINRMAHSVTAHAKRTSPASVPVAAPSASVPGLPLASGTAATTGSSPLTGSVYIHAAPCVVYGNATASAQSQAAGCNQVETVRFSPMRTRKLIDDWARYNDARLLAGVACPPYATWSGEIQSQPAQTDAALFESLHELYTDALKRGCLRVTHAVPGATLQLHARP